MLASLRNRNFALLWVGQLVSLAGDWVLLIALPFFVYTLTGSTLATGAMFIAQTLPRLALGSLAGVFVDRWDRRATMLASDLLRAALLLPLLLVRSPDRAWIVYVVAFAEASVSQFFLPAEGALLPRLVGEGDALLAANALNSLSQNLTQLVGPALGGLLYGALGLTSVVAFDAASFLVSALLIALIATPRSATADTGGAQPAAGLAVWREWREGLRLVRQDRILATLFLVIGTVMIGQGLIMVLLVAWVKGVLGGGSTEFGWLMSAQAVGSLLGGLVLGKVSRLLSPAKLIGLAGLLDGALLLAIFNIPVLALDLVLIGLAGIPIVGLTVSLQTLLQNTTADAYRGRVFGAFLAVIALAQLLGMALASLLGDRLGAVLLLDLDGVLWIVGGVLALTLLTGALRQTAAPAANQPA